MQFLKKNAFIIFLCIAVGVAFLVPSAGATDGPLKTGLTVKLGIMLVFFLQGLSLKTKELLSDLKEWRLHLLIQSWIFIFSPFIILIPVALFYFLGMQELGAGFIFLALLPTTISSAVTLTSAAEGNVPAAIFNTTLSNIIGVFWVPILCIIIFSGNGGIQADLTFQLLTKLVYLIILPMIAGQAIQPIISKSTYFVRSKKYFKHVSNGVIVFIVFAAFSKSVLSNSWNSVETWNLIVLFPMVAGTMLLVHFCVWMTSIKFLASRRNQITALFCGSQKTLATGVPMAMAIFSSNIFEGTINTGLILLPLMAYHPLQLLGAAFLLPKLQKTNLPQ